MKRAVFLLFSCALWCVAAVAQPATLTGAQILQKSAEAYAQLKSYSGRTTVISESYIMGIHLAQTASAQIEFERPGKLRITGRDSSGNSFTIISNGDSTWLSWPLQNEGGFGQEKDVWIAISKMTGVALLTPTYVPSALLTASNGMPFDNVEGAQLMGRETVGGVDCYHVVVNDSGSKRAYWVDVQTLLLRQFQREETAAQVRKALQSTVDELKTSHSPALKTLSQAAPDFDKTGASISLYLFSNSQLDSDIPDGMFLPPNQNQ